MPMVVRGLSRVLPSSNFDHFCGDHLSVSTFLKGGTDGVWEPSVFVSQEVDVVSFEGDGSVEGLHEMIFPSLEVQGDICYSANEQDKQLVVCDSFPNSSLAVDFLALNDASNNDPLCIIPPDLVHEVNNSN